MRRLVGATVAVLALVLLVVPSAASPLALPATVRGITPPTETLTYPSFDVDGNALGPVAWNVVEGTGNCCENYLASDADGALYDFGGNALNYSPDGGTTWNQVLARINGTAEGVVSAAPGGDVVGATWFPYTGDRLVAFKYDASEGEWLYAESPLHAPFYDRPWISVVPGPVTFAGQTAPYLTILRGGFPSKEPWLFSLDGLAYLRPSSPALEGISPGSFPQIPVLEDGDWVQPHVSALVAPLNGAGALARPDVIGSGGLKLLRPDLQWRRTNVPGANGADAFQVDAAGRMHVVELGRQIVYRLSTDPGRDWREVMVPLPVFYQVEEFDVKANAALSTTVVALHVHDTNTNTDRDLVYRFGTAGDVPVLERIYHVGNGDLNATRGLGGGEDRFDFSTTVLLADGRIATSFVDQDHGDPAVAILAEP